MAKEICARVADTVRIENETAARAELSRRACRIRPPSRQAGSWPSSSGRGAQGCQFRRQNFRTTTCAIVSGWVSPE